MWQSSEPSLCLSSLLHSWIKGLTTKRHRRGPCFTLLRFSKLRFPVTIEQTLFFCETHHLFEAFVVSHCANKTSAANTSQNATWKIHQEKRVELVNPQLDIKRACAWRPSIRPSDHPSILMLHLLKSPTAKAVGCSSSRNCWHPKFHDSLFWFLFEQMYSSSECQGQLEG